MPALPAKAPVKDPVKAPAKAKGSSSLFQAEYCEQARKLCLLGAIDRDLARILGVSERTINNWKRQHPEFAAALKAGKAAADAEVAEALHNKALKGDMSAIPTCLKKSSGRLNASSASSTARPINELCLMAA